METLKYWLDLMAEYVRDEDFDFCGPLPPWSGWYWASNNAWKSHRNRAWEDAYLIANPDEDDIPF